ncbi:MAG: flagellar hook capping FlgD N-terminal domain-containing protein [Roseovarius sp.]
MNTLSTPLATPQPGIAAPQQAGGTESARTAGAIGADFETFLKMLTTQMRNQDPLNPLDSTEFATQLATFSSVEQQVLTNDLLTGLAAQMNALSVAQLTGWIGMDASAEMPVIFDGAPVTITTQGSHLADSAQLVVRDDSGRELQRVSIGLARAEQEWAGVDEDGQPLAAGTYDLTVESFSGDTLISTDPVIVEARIVEARNENGFPILVMNTGQEVPSSAIIALRDPG